ncbi:hypothetical protein B0T24DRAFT_230840 [Lasiosphaeria ovina]|uniref:Uncharacterized protein n=1 Tax=Lasiosphaeria ovina TaxID=92902 RepID=A0AAE0KIY2_9PEZI|nr:hypothetical protein B0T24DRAFT_230840 [Lasiosphaeria ovina]
MGVPAVSVSVSMPVSLARRCTCPRWRLAGAGAGAPHSLAARHQSRSFAATSASMHEAYWRLHPEMERPLFPYRGGKHFPLRPYNPPFFPRRIPYDRNEVHAMHPVDRCVKYPPDGFISGVPFSVRFTDQIRSDSSHNNAIFGVTLHGPPLPGIDPALVAASEAGCLALKVYDPVWYYSASTADPMSSCDLAFNTEVAVYHDLRKLWGTVVPRFFGTYVIGIPIEKRGNASYDKVRNVRAVLMEHVRGIRVGNMPLISQTYSQEIRKRIVGAYLDATSALWRMGIAQVKLQPESLILVPGSFERGGGGPGIQMRMVGFTETPHRRHPDDKPDYKSRERMESRWDIAHRFLNHSRGPKRWYDDLVYLSGPNRLIDWDIEHWLRNEYGVSTREYLAGEALEKEVFGVSDNFLSNANKVYFRPTLYQAR